MGLLDFLRPKLQHPDPRVRLQALEGLDNQQRLIELARHDDSPRVRLAAVARLEDDALLAEVARDAVALDVRLAAVERIGDQRLLAEIIKSRRNYELMVACFARITDRALLQDIAQDPAYNPAARRMAVEQFADESYLADITPAEEADGGRKSEAAVDAILATYGDVRVVRALGRFKGSEKALRALGTIARKGGEVGGLAAEYLCRALGSRNPTLARCAADELAVLQDAESVACLVRALDDPNICQAVREVLRRIDTPEARRALQDGA
jgi:hypothetical protein